MQGPFAIPVDAFAIDTAAGKMGYESMQSANQMIAVLSGALCAMSLGSALFGNRDALKMSHLTSLIVESLLAYHHSSSESDDANTKLSVYFAAANVLLLVALILDGEGSRRKDKQG